MAPLVSVVIPVRDRTFHLFCAVRSAARQTYPHIEIIVVDDASTRAVNTSDLSVAAACDGFSRRLKVIRVPQPVGACAVRNTGIEAAEGLFIAFLDSDDMWHPTKIERQVEALLITPQPERGLCYTGRVSIREGHGLTTLQLATRTETGGWRETMDNAIGPLSSVMVAKSLLLEIGGFDTRLPASQDWDLFLRIQPRTTPVRIEAPLLYFRTGRMDRISASSRKRLAGHLAMRRKHFSDKKSANRSLDLKIARDLLAERRWRAFLTICMLSRPGLGTARAVTASASSLAAQSWKDLKKTARRRVNTLLARQFLQHYRDEFHMQQEAATRAWRALSRPDDVGGMSVSDDDTASLMASEPAHPMP